MFTNKPCSCFNDPDINPDLIMDVTAFHEKFNRPSRSLDNDIEADLMKFRIRFLAEELKEINAASARGDLVEILDGLVDLVYVAIGTAHQLNMNFAEAWRRVQEANMAKVPVSAENPGKRGHATDIVKPEGWTPPCHKDLFTKDDLEHTPLNLNGRNALVDLSAYFAS